MENLKGQTVSGVIWSAVEGFSLKGVQFFISILMARLLSPSDYGILGMLAIFMAISQVFIDGGFSTALIQDRHKKAEDYSTVFYINLGISVLLYVILFLCAPYIADFYSQPSLNLITRIYSLNLVIGSLSAVNSTLLVIRVDFKTKSKISFLSASVSGIIGVCCAFAGFGVWALVMQVLSSSVFSAILSFWFVRWLPSAVFSVDSFKKLFSFGSKMLVATLVSHIYSNLYTVVIGKRFTSSALGNYTKADNFAQFTSANISGILSRVCFPVLSEIQEDDVRLLKFYRKFIKMTTFITFPLILLLCGVAKPLVLFLLGAKWTGCIHLLQILSLAYLFDGVITLNLNLLYVKGRSDLVLRLELIKKSVAFSILFTTMFYNLTIICWGLLLYSLIGFYLNTIYTKKLLSYGFLKQIKDFWGYLVLSLFVMLEALAISELITMPLFALILSFPVCITTYICIANWCNFSAYSDFREIMRPYINKIVFRKF